MNADEGALGVTCVFGPLAHVTVRPNLLGFIGYLSLVGFPLLPCSVSSSTTVEQVPYRLAEAQCVYQTLCGQSRVGAWIPRSLW